MTYILNIKTLLPFLFAPVFCLCFGTTNAWAQKISSISIYQTDNTKLIASSTSTTEGEKDEYFNLARCLCSEPGEDTDMFVKLMINEWSASDDTLVAVVVGSGTCLETQGDKTELDPDCTTILGETGQVKKIKDLDAEFDIVTKTVKLMGGDCSASSDAVPMKIHVFTDESKTEEQWQSQAFIEYTIDLVPPDGPKVSEIVAGEELVEITFTAPSSSSSTNDAGPTATDPAIRGYQVLCEIAATGMGPDSTFEPGYVSTINLCGLTPAPTTDGGVDGAVDTASPDAAVPDMAKPDMAKPDMGTPDVATPDMGPSDMATSDADAVSPDTVSHDTVSHDTVPPDTMPPDTVSQETVETTEILNKAYVCSPISNSSGTIEIDNLTNGVEYNFYIVTIDQLYNPSEPVKVGLATPEPAEDIWERYKRSGGTAQGGYCSLAGEIPKWPAAPLLLLGLALMIHRLRKTRRPPWAGGRP